MVSKAGVRAAVVLCLILMILTGQVVAADQAEAAAATISVSGQQWGHSTCSIGAHEGSTARFEIADLEDLGINAYRVWASMARLEWEDDDDSYGSPTIAAIEADPDEIDWSWWDDVMTASPQGPFPEPLADQIAALNGAGVEPVLQLRTFHSSDNGWLPPPTQQNPWTEDEWNEWWAYVFAVAYWINVREDLTVDRFQVNNEPNHGSVGGWPGTIEQYFELVEYTNDALDHVYSTYLPGRSYRVHAPVTASFPQAWVLGALEEIPDSFTTVDIHNYNNNMQPGTQTVRGWMSQSGQADKELWVSEWGRHSGTSYDTPEIAVGRVVANVIRGSRPGINHIDGSHIFKMYDGGGFEGLINGQGDRNLSYYGLRMATRALQGCRPTFEITTSTNDLVSITSQDDNGNTYFIVANQSASNEYDVTVDISSILQSGTGTMWRTDAFHNDEVVDYPTVEDGEFTFTLPGYSAVLVEFPADQHVAVSDSFVRGGSFATSNFGTDERMVVKLTDNVPPDDTYTRWSYLKFDLDDLDVEDVGQVNLRLFMAHEGVSQAPTEEIEMEVYPVSDTSWSETGITWNNRPSLGGSPLDSVTLVPTCPLNTPCQWYVLDVTDYVVDELSAERTTISLALRNPDPSAQGVRISSREANSNQPHLQVLPAR